MVVPPVSIRIQLSDGHTSHVESNGHMSKKPTPDFQTAKERDDYFRENADYFTVVSRGGVGTYVRNECKTLAEAEKLAQTKRVVAGGGWLIYAVIGQQSALVKAIPATKEGS